MSIFTPGNDQKSTGLGDLIAGGIEALSNAYKTKKEAEAKVEIANTAAGAAAPYTTLLMMGAALVLVVIVLKKI